VDAKSADYSGKALSGRAVRRFRDAGAFAVSNAMEPDAPYCALGFRSGIEKITASKLFSRSGLQVRPYLFAYDSAKLPSEMNKLQKWWKAALVIVVLVIVLQAGCLFWREPTACMRTLRRIWKERSDAGGSREFRRADSAESETGCQRCDRGEDPAFATNTFFVLNT